MCCLDCFRVPKLERKIEELNYEADKAQGEIEYLKNTKVFTDSEITRTYECKLCMEQLIEVVFLPCGHTLSCRNCAKSCKVCPVCNLQIDSKTSIHIM